MRSKFDEQLAQLNKDLTQMGAMCEEAIALAVTALSEGNSKNAAKVAPLDTEIDQMERDIESLCLKLLLQQQPVAHDLRQISAALKMVTDMERIGDQASDIAEIVGFLNQNAAKRGEHGIDTSGSYNLIRQMAIATIKMVTESVEAYVKHDVTLAKETISHDDVVDSYFTQVKTALIRMVAQNPDDGEYILDLLMIAKYFERIGDHAVNIAEWVVFSVTGEHVTASRQAN